MGCCAGCMKWTLIVLNVIVVLLGVIAVGFGIYILLDKSDILDLIGNTSEMPAFLDKTTIVLIVGGTLVAIVAAIGLCGAWKSNRRLLCVYGVALTLALVVQAIAIILAIIYRDEIEGKFRAALKTSLSQSYVMPRKPDKGVNAFSTAWDSIQYELECCGVVDEEDYRDATYWHKTDNLTATDTTWPVPRSCCKYANPWVYPDDYVDLKPMSTSCYPSWNTTNTWTNAGCYKEMKSQLFKASLMIIGVGVATVITQLLLLLFAWALFCGWCGTKEVLV
ncbi:tetraspanin-18-like [Liolophura sinensis]|uniref:tetraspanin-18-like n=1 Tax=Liolophura sinensis TaxID=3198878 RepID=UPI003158117E